MNIQLQRYSGETSTRNRLDIVVPGYLAGWESFRVLSTSINIS